jgi:hypothetical protein
MNKLSDTSVILPFYKKHNELEFSLHFNYTCLEKVKEVIVVFDEPDNLENNNYFKYYSKIPFVFYMNNENHPWRNPCIPINYGIQKSTGKYIIILSPETIILDNALETLLENTNDETYACGSVIFTTYNGAAYHKIYDKNRQKEIFNSPFQTKYYKGPTNYGSICCTKSNFLKVNLYTEDFFNKGWGEEDNDVREKLENINIKKKYITEAKFVHLEDKPSINRIEKKEYKKYAKSLGLTTVTIGTREFRIKQKNINNKYNNYNLYNLENKNKKLIDVKHESIIKFEANCVNNSYPIILLVQSYNEEKNVVEFLSSVNNFVDGIILLDDESTDNTYGLFDLKTNDKIIGKFQKKRNDNFNDIENRNLLLSIYEKITHQCENQWVLWLDLDERLADDYNTILTLRKNLLSNQHNFDILTASFFHMWNETHYNAEYPVSNQGVQKKYRLFKKTSLLEPYAINSSKKLHFNLCPNTKIKPSYGNFPMSIKNLGTLSKSLRINKFNSYTLNYDKNQDQGSYDHLLKNDPKLEEFVPNIIFFDYCKRFGDILYNKNDKSR